MLATQIYQPSYLWTDYVANRDAMILNLYVTFHRGLCFNISYLFIAQVLKVCRTPGPTGQGCYTRCVWKKSEKFHGICNHLIYAQTLTGVHQVVGYFLLAIFHASISIETLERNSLSLRTPNGLYSLFIYLFIYCFTALTGAEGL